MAVVGAGVWDAPRMLLSFFYRAFVAVLRLISRRGAEVAAREAELLVLRHELAVLRRTRPRRGFARLTGRTWLR